MAELLVLCDATDHMRRRLAETFDPVDYPGIAGFEAWLARAGARGRARVRYILTDGGVGVPPDVMQALPNLALIGSSGVGYDGIDTDAATARGIPVCHTPNVLDEEVATTALMLYLACRRNLEAEMAHARSGRWAAEGALPLSRTADNRTVGILGLGRIGKAIARKLAPFHPILHYCGRRKQDVPFSYHATPVEMAKACDTVISVVPGGPGTRRLVDRTVIDAIGPDGILVNVGRGSVVDETALVAALRDGRLGGAGLDVFEDEPNIPRALRALPNVVLTPHVGSATVATRRAMADLAIDNLIAHKNGRPLPSHVPESAGLL